MTRCRRKAARARPDRRWRVRLERDEDDDSESVLLCLGGDEKIAPASGSTA
jgi:hypothetical protein